MESIKIKDAAKFLAAPAMSLFIIFFLYAGAAYPMSVTLKDGAVYKAAPGGAENLISLKKGDTEETVSIDEIKTIDFSDEAAKAAEGDAESAGVSIIIPPDVKAILDMVPDKSKFPNAGGYIIKDEDVYTLNADGTYKVRSHYIFKIFEDRAADGNIIMGYAFERESARIVMGRTIQPDGRVSNLNPEDIKEGDMFRGAQFYSNTQKVISATLPDVKKGSIIEYIIEMNVFKPLIEGYFCPTVYFVANEPKRMCRVEIRTPKGKKLKWVSKNFDRIYDSSFDILKAVKEPKISETANETVYLFEIADVAEFISEPSMPAYKDSMPYIQFSSYDNWDKIYDWFNANFEKHVNAISPEMKTKTEEITKNCKTAEEKIAAVYHYIQQQNRYISIKGDLVAGLTGHDARRTFDNKYGDCVDKAILMSAMLKIIGVESYPTLINAGGPQWAIETAHLELNHSISFVRYDSREIFLDATSQDSRFPFLRTDDHDRYSMVPQLKKHIKSGMPLSVQKSYRQVVINKNGGISVKGRREFDGAFEYWVRMANKSLKESEIKDSFKQRLNVTLPGVVLNKIEYTDLMDLNRQVVETVEYEAPDAVIVAGGLILFAVPGYSFDFEEVSLKERKYPIDYQYLTRTENTFEFKIPEGYGVKYVPKNFAVEDKYVKFGARYEIKDGSTIVFSDYFERKQRTVDVADYASYKSNLESIARYAGEKAVIEKTGR
ncbi:MAG TPA: DUF3857 and transglutaminase domain-containing protein [Candidatus Wallbacteria bacterium]|nr:DUF3857 and transglutaminase domain-containing protein [Candidatus Wallbacteria bacterium]